jgi:hypothetical protein
MNAALLLVRYKNSTLFMLQRAKSGYKKKISLEQTNFMILVIESDGENRIMWSFSAEMAEVAKSIMVRDEQRNIIVQL